MQYEKYIDNFLKGTYKKYVSKIDYEYDAQDRFQSAVIYLKQGYVFYRFSFTGNGVADFEKVLRFDKKAIDVGSFESLFNGTLKYGRMMEASKLTYMSGIAMIQKNDLILQTPVAMYYDEYRDDKLRKNQKFVLKDLNLSILVTEYHRKNSPFAMIFYQTSDAYYPHKKTDTQSKQQGVGKVSTRRKVKSPKRMKL
jgi:hypothetical protein